MSSESPRAVLVVLSGGPGTGDGSAGPWTTMSSMEVSARISQWVVRQFPEDRAEQVLSELRDLPASVVGRQDPERIQAALVIRTGGDWQAFQGMLRLAHEDWRDLLVAAGLGHEDWPSVLDEVLGATAAPA